MLRIILPAVLMLLSACTANQRIAGATPAYRTVAFEISSWGRPLGNWEVSSRSCGPWTSSSAAGPNGIRQPASRTYATERYRLTHCRPSINMIS